MAIVEKQTFPTADNDSTDLPNLQDFDIFLYFRDVLASADMSIMSLKMLHNHLVYPQLPKPITATLEMIPETQQISALIPDLLIKINDLRTLCEGGLMASASARLSNHSLSLVKDTLSEN